MLAVAITMKRRSRMGKRVPTVTTKNAGSEAMFEKVSFEGLAEVFLTDQVAAEHLEPYFNGMPVLDISHEVICGYVLHRIQQGASADRVDRELLTLKRMFEKAMATFPPMVVHAPRIPLPDEVEAMRRAWLRTDKDNGDINSGLQQHEEQPMPQEPSAEELLKRFEAVCREQQYEFEAIYADVRQALALLDDGNHCPALVALGCIAIGVLRGKPYGEKIIESGFEAVGGGSGENDGHFLT